MFKTLRLGHRRTDGLGLYMRSALLLGLTGRPKTHKLNIA